MLTKGDKLGHYEILSPLGEGGMGEVYRARDTRLGRDVAIKVIPERYVHDTERMARFAREAQVLASLNHPNIAAIYGVEDRALVMELVEGITLEGRIAQGAMPAEEVQTIARQIAEALEAAHDKGITHRDLKPANVKITPQGVVKVLDFGLATFTGAPGAISLDPVNSPTIAAASIPGMIVGTPAYMSPEQASGKAVDRRTDIWAFGVLLWEMLSGKPLFGGETISHTLADVLRSPINVGALPKSIPPAMRSLLRRCLERDVRNRLQAIGEARIMMDTGTVSVEPAAGEGKSGPRPLVWMLAAIVFAAMAVALAFVHFREAQPESRVTRLQLAPPERMAFLDMALSPDAKTLAFSSRGARSRSQLWVRPLDANAATALAGTSGAYEMTWSPDGKLIAFDSENKLKKINASGGPPQTICDVLDMRGVTWLKDGTIVFGMRTGPLQRVTASGGEPKPLTNLDNSHKEESHRYPVFLPDGLHYLYLVRSGQPEHTGIYLGEVGSTLRRRLLPDRSSVGYATTSSGVGMILFARSGALMAQPFDARRLQLSGEAVSVAPQVNYTYNSSHATFVVAPGGAGSPHSLLVFDAGQPEQRSQLTWFDRSGKELSRLGEPGVYQVPRVSPDESQVMVAQRDPQSGAADLWLLDAKRAITSRFTTDPRAELMPIWSPDGSRVVFAANWNGGFDLFWKATGSGSKTEESLYNSVDWKWPGDWSSDGRFLLYSERSPKTNWDLWAMPMNGDRKPFPLVQSDAIDWGGKFSPEGKWVAYYSNESGRNEVYVQAFPGPGGRTQVSRGGGASPAWKRDGKELYYKAPTGIMAVEVRTSPGFQIGAARELFANPEIEGVDSFGTVSSLPVTGDGQRFLLRFPLGETAPSAATVVLNWDRALQQ